MKLNIYCEIYLLIRFQFKHIKKEEEEISIDVNESQRAWEKEIAHACHTEKEKEKTKIKQGNIFFTNSERKGEVKL